MKVEEFAAALDRLERLRDTWRLTVRYFRSHGIERMSYTHMPPPGASDADQMRVAAEGFPPDWARRYVADRLYRIDPLALFSSQSPQPFFWRDIDELKVLSKDERRFLRMLDAAGSGDGLGIQVFGPNGRNGYCGLGLAKDAVRPSGFRINEFQWVCQLAHLKYCAILVPRLAKPQPLTARETEILRWVARGKSNAVIADILGVSPHTVDAYLRRIYLKLGVVDRLSAALRGFGIGLLHAEN